MTLARVAGRGAPLVVATALALATHLAVPAHAQEGAGPPDELHPPAPWEDEYPEDPSEPAGSTPVQASAQPTARYAAEGQRFEPQRLVGLAGANRFLTGVEVSRRGWDGGADVAVLVTGEDFADALAAAALAGVAEAPLLLTPRGALDEAVDAELRRLGVQHVYAVGPLTSAVVNAVREVGADVTSIRGEDRYETAHALALAAAELGADTSVVLVARGDDFADALSGSSLSAATGHPILLTPGTGGAATLEEQIAELEAEQVWVVGGPAAVPDDTVAGLPGVERLHGPDRVGTSLAVAERMRELGFEGVPVLASAGTFPDGLTGGVLAGAVQQGPLLLTFRNELSSAVAGWLDEHRPASLSVVGGTAAISAFTRCQLEQGDSRAFLCVEGELERQGYHTGAVDGKVGAQTVWAFYAFKKVAGLGVNGTFREEDVRRLLQHPRLTPRRTDLGKVHVEIDLGRQLVLVVRDGEVVHALHTSTGKPSTPTVRGLFTVYEKRNFRQSWNAMYRPVFFFRGYAFHGYPEIPLHPASAGCARLYDGDMDLLWPFLQIGTRVLSY